jgi:hypothetical protein
MIICVYKTIYARRADEVTADLIARGIGNYICHDHEMILNGTFRLYTTYVYCDEKDTVSTMHKLIAAGYQPYLAN